MQWLAVQNAPSDELGLVWVAEGGNDGKGCVAFGTVKRYPDGDIFAIAQGYQGDFTITHWMALPADPNNKEETT